MAVENLPVFDITWITTSAATMDDNGGYQFALNSDWIQIAVGATSQTIQVNDTTNNTFDDDQSTGQTIQNGYTINGVFYAAGTIIESEYELVVEDAAFNRYTLQFVSLAEDAWNIEGFIFQGVVPPFGEQLTVVGRTDGASGLYTYDAMTDPACFAAGTRIMTDRGPRRAEDLRPGARMCLADGGHVTLAAIIVQHVRLGGDARKAPVRLMPGALGPDLPRHVLVVSPQHRLRLPDGAGLGPARAFQVLPRVGLLRQARLVTYVHLVTAQHSIILAEGIPAETFWPGRQALEALSPATRRMVRRVMGHDPRPAADLLTMGQATTRLGTPQDIRALAR